MGINSFMFNLCFHCADFHKTHSCLLSFRVHLLYQILSTSDDASRNWGELHSWPYIKYEHGCHCIDCHVTDNYNKVIYSVKHNIYMIINT